MIQKEEALTEKDIEAIVDLLESVSFQDIQAPSTEPGMYREELKDISSVVTRAQQAIASFAKENLSAAKLLLEQVKRGENLLSYQHAFTAENVAVVLHSLQGTVAYYSSVLTIITHFKLPDRHSGWLPCAVHFFSSLATDQMLRT